MELNIEYKSAAKKVIEQAQQEVDEEDRRAAIEELKKHLKKGRWERIRNPVYQRGIWHGLMCACIMLAVLAFLLGPFWLDR